MTTSEKSEHWRTVPVVTEWPGQFIREDSKQVATSSGWIQWKGTNVCMDIYCVCGAHSHMDVDFLYFFQCFRCKAVYAVGQTVQLYPVTPEVQKVHQRHGFPTDDQCDKR